MALRPNEKLLFLYLLTNSKTSIAGVYELPMATMIFETGLPRARIEKILQKFRADKKVYYIKSWVVLCNFPKHQKWEQRQKIRQGIDAVLRRLPAWLREELPKLPYAYDSRAYGYDIDSHTYDSNGSPPESESESESERESESDKRAVEKLLTGVADSLGSGTVKGRRS